MRQWRPGEAPPPDWISLPIILSSLIAVPNFIALAVVSPISVLLGIVPIVIVLPVMLWLDRVEPEPRPALIHAFLWGATVAVTVAGIVNTIVAIAGGEVLAAVVSAPLVEEAMKACGIIYALRRKEIDGVMDGIVYAGWVALGFAVIEDISYFAQSPDGGVLAQTFVLRALFGPFAHPLFTAWTGLAIGRAVSKGKPVFPNAVWGYVAAVASTRCGTARWPALRRGVTPARCCSSPPSWCSCCCSSPR
ncbi:MAG: PrsW family intramembrane metalloprotease [Acidimicrobiales bacterium]